MSHYKVVHQLNTGLFGSLVHILLNQAISLSFSAKDPLHHFKLYILV